MRFHSKMLQVLLCAMVVLIESACGLATIDTTIGGTVSGLTSGTTVNLLNNGTDQITVSANGNFSFDATLAAGANYSVTVATQPSGEICTVTGGTGTVTENELKITTVAVNCVANGSSNNVVLGTVSGLNAGNSAVLLDNGVDPITVSSNGLFVFPTSIPVGSTYLVTVSKNPAGQTCLVVNPSSVVPPSGTSTNVIVNCQ